MTKTEFIEKYAENAGLSKAQADKAFHAFFATLSNALVSGDKVVFPGLLKAEVTERAARTGRNPQTGEAMQIPAKKVIKAKLGDKLLK